MHSSIKIFIPSNNIYERLYVIDVIFKNFLGIEYTIYYHIKDEYLILWGDKSLHIKDSFFSKFHKDLSYLNIVNIPSKITYYVGAFSSVDNLPVLYGENIITKSGENSIFCSIDIFASVFFMLSRWEEIVIPEKDVHDRFRSQNCLACQYNFIDRPIVNEYVELLWNLIYELDSNIERKQRKFKFIPTHDIDFLEYPIKKHLRTMCGDLVKRLDIKSFIYRLAYFFTDPYDKFEFLVEMSEKYNFKSHFYFMASDRISPLEDSVYYLNNKKFKDIVRYIKDQGHIIGFHPGYYTYNDENEWSREKIRLENSIAQQVKESRQHFLRFHNPITLKILEKEKIEVDSSLGYADHEGFRCGTGDEYPLFDILDRKVLNVFERPLLIMDGTLNGYRSYSKEIVYDIVKKYIDICVKYRSCCTILFHNSSFTKCEWNGYETLYQSILQYAASVDVTR